MSNLPRMARIRQAFPRPVLADIEQTIKDELKKLLAAKVIAGQKIGITAGSRGIQNIVPMLKVVVDYVRELGAEPVMLAAMGSHGGGTEQGQSEVLDSLGMTEQALGAQVLVCAESDVIGATSEGIPAYILKSALSVDGILVINRIKTHTSFKGKVESGLIKKLVVGLGGPAGAKQFHNFGSEELPRLLVEIGEIILQKLPILGGLSIIENAYEETARIDAIEREQMVDKEAELLLYSKSLMPSLPIPEIDFLIIKEMGKNFSGTGIDTNIIGRIRIEGVPEPDSPNIKRIAVLDISEESHGNATGIGLADLVTQRVVDQMDRHATYLNCLTSTFVIRAAIPMYFDNDEKLVEAALLSLGGIPTDKLRVMIIPNTLFLTDILVSETVLDQLKDKPGIEIESEARALEYDQAGNLIFPWIH
jgi:hypothetical protein